MANATVEKIKKLGLRHGEKAVVGLTAALSLVLIVAGLSRESIDLTPDQIKKSADAAESNLRRPQTEESIKERLDEAKLVPIDFAARVDQRKQEPAVTYAFTGPSWVQPEPGAGLIRDTPELVAPTELYATAGRGAIEVFDRDDDGNLIYVEVKKEDAKKKAPSRSRRKSQRGRGGASGMAGGGMMGGYGGMMGGGGQPKGELAKAEAKKKAEAEARRKAALFVGEAKEEAEAEDIEAKAKEGKEPKEVTRGYRWMALVGVLDHQKIKDSYVRALKDPGAQPHYLRLDLQRQVLVEDGEWSDWQDVDRTVNETMDASFTEQDDELAPSDVVLPGLAARLPFLKVGYYKGVHVASLVPKDKREAPKPPDEEMAGSAYGRMMGGGMGSMMGMQPGMGGGMSGSMPDAGGSRRMMGMMGGGMEGMSGGGMMGGGMSGGGPEDTNFEKSTKPELMVRALDYTVEPDTAYRYRVRVVVRNPNLGWDTVAPGVDTMSEELYGPWTEPLDPVRVPADVTTYAVRQSLDPKQPDAVEFQVVRWDESTGLTIVKTFTEAAGQIIGEPTSASVPRDENKGTRSQSIDFTSRQLLIDTAGGTRPLSTLDIGATRFNAPAMALVLRNDGQLVLRDQSRDAHDTEMKQLEAIYRETLKDAEAGGKKPPTGGMMGGYGGRMGMSGAQ